MNYHAVIAGIFFILTAGVVAMGIQYLRYRSKVTRGREWHPERRVRKPFWL